MKSVCLIATIALLTNAVAAEPAQPPKPGAAAAAAPKPRVPFPHDGTPGSILTKLTQARDEDPLRFVAADMGVIVTDLSSLKTDKPIQTKQEKVVARLDELIAALEKACKGGGGGGPNPTKPLNDSILAKGPGGQGEMIDPKQGDKQWASLPPKQRDQILQSQTEGFPPGYERILQSYYQRLSEERVGADAAPADAGAK